ncbi:uncharacterized protein B0H64DRAFT_379283 [Chaetomium fimeti]|uniref:Uncharacterized protein n=1 Tax=Chaetomium fimeti TaxID=1854472 RepID=A0AAE0HNI9_9PEZI|nr:hypothetical protein B0H64DRAFT_379283 [Chaetomium fimeti]
MLYSFSVPDMPPELSRDCPLRSGSATAPRPAGLLTLTPHLRHFIYLHIDVARFDGYPYTFFLNGHKDSPGLSRYEPPPSRNFMGLLLSCRVLYTEVASLLYSANRFILFYTHQRTLRPLRALSPTSIAALTNLKIVLNESSCHNPTNAPSYPPPCCFHRLMAQELCAKHHGSEHRRPLLDSLSGITPAATRLATQPMLTEWHNTAAYLSSHATPGRLELWFVCDIDPAHEYALEAAQRLVAPLALFPLLKDCHVRLCSAPNRPLQRLAEEAVLPARPGSPPLSPLLTNLPAELRLRILEYTDLVTPWKEVTWCRRNRRYYIFSPNCLMYEGGCPPHIHHGCPLIRCTHDEEYIPGKDIRRVHGCFCRRLHGAYTSTCKCWVPPTRLFLINRLLRHEAETIFFSHNRFVVHDFYAIPPQNLRTYLAAHRASHLPAHFPPDPIPRFDPDEPFDGPPTNERDYVHTRFAASEFLRAVVPTHCLAHLRFLELLFPPYVPNDWPLERRSLQREWRATVAWASHHLNLPALAVRVVMSYPLVHPDVRRELSEEEGTRILRGYWRAASPWKELARERGLGGLWVQTAYPFRGEMKSVYCVGLKWEEEWMEEKERALKAQYEHIPGREGSGRVEPLRGVWQRWYEVPYY